MGEKDTRREQKRREWKRDTEKNPKTVETGTKKPDFPEEEKEKPATGNKQRGESAKAQEENRSERYDLPYTRASAEIPIKANPRMGLSIRTDGRYVKMIEVHAH